MNSKKTIKAVGLVSGGLDSSLAAAVVRELGVEVYGMFFVLPWKCGKLDHARTVASGLGIPLKIEPCREDFIDMIRNARYGYGAGLNPCVDCHLFMIRKAAAYMRSLEADFVFTGEVLGQRPLSQLKNSLRIIDEQSGLQGRLLRPLSAKMLEPTIPEKEGLIDREKLYALSGRSRKEQFRMADALHVKGFAQPAGGCLLTEPHFGRRLKDLFQYGYRAWNDLIMLEWGRHFRITKDFKAIVGRDERENVELTAHAHPRDYILEITADPGPTVILQGIDPHSEPSEEVLATAAALLRRYSRNKDKNAASIFCHETAKPHEPRTVTARVLSDQDLDRMNIQ